MTGKESISKKRVDSWRVRERVCVCVCKKSGRVKVRVKKIEGQIWKQRKQREGAKMVKKKDGSNKEIHIDCSI